VKHHLARQWFLIGLALVLGVGLTASGRLQPLANATLLRNGVVAAVMFITALPLETGAMWRVLRRPWATVLAVAMNFGLLPLVAWVVSLGLRGQMAEGLLIAAAMPCTLASAAVWTRRAGGNDAVAILVTIITNLACFVVTPLWLVATTKTHVEIGLGEMMFKLAVLVVLPIVVAQLLRQYRPVGQWADRRKSRLSVLAQCGILMIVLIGALRCGNELAQTEARDVIAAGDLLGMTAGAIGVHLAILVTGHAVGWLLGMSLADRIAVGFAGSQKTLMVGLHVAITYYGGLTILPLVVYHVGQLLVDTLIADYLRRRG
jgi:sodium/bile acid cotransporter 7